MATTAAEVQWLLYLLKDLQVQQKSPSLMFCDNPSAIHITNNNVFHERTKHLDTDCHFIRPKVQNGIIHLMSVSSKNQLADVFTKSLHSPVFKEQVNRLGLISIQ